MKKLNKIQKRILWIGILILVAITAYPPWTAVTNPPEYDVTIAIGYGLFLHPPNSPLGYESYVVINYWRLFLQWAGLAILVWFAIWLARKK
ncbi:MAG: hypothetical protein HQ542_12870 [Bacteroidia bacterium]|nr:hypothetical protein [Bacteroidia bacterium]